MLALTRRVGESIYIGNDIIVTISRVHGSSVVVGISAPREVPIVRSELVDDFDEDEAA